MAWSASSAYFVTLVAHGTMLVMALSDINEYVMATLPLIDWTEREYADVETSLTIAISLGIACCAIESYVACIATRYVATAD
ncbi:unnamed protein product [Cercopithifilaria johnstoni]|uniref:Uncharacterized protein n=1 Tax=Cercopithifilaria johnstoni TaxID=2874296 RepID=A0A8J2Q4K1_9BILA|nr:unnamed protein product [Cercopithifilaria johnstoni]